MKLIAEAREKTGKDLYAEKYEFRWCTGSVEPDTDEEAFKGLVSQDAEERAETDVVAQ